MNTPKPLSIEEWKEVMEVPDVRQSWGLSGDETPEEFAEMVYGVKFYFVCEDLRVECAARDWDIGHGVVQGGLWLNKWSKCDFSLNQIGREVPGL